MNKIAKRIDDEINRLWAETDGIGRNAAPCIIKGLEKAKNIIEIDCCNKCREDYNQLDKDYTAILEENDRLEYQKRFSAVQTKKYIEIIDSLMEKIDKLESQEEHDGCVNCKYVDKLETEYPCKDCKQNFIDKYIRELHTNNSRVQNKTENISRTPEQIEELANGFIRLAERLKETETELQEVKYRCKDWELEAKKAVAKLGEIMILMDGEKNNE